jgi:hypothetical protein
MLRVGLALLFGTLMVMLAQAQSMAEAGAQLADDFKADLISSLPRRPTTVSIEIQNLAALAPAELSSFRAALREGLQKAGMEAITAGQPETRLRVAISENVRGLLFVAVATSSENRQVAMLPWNIPVATERKPRVKTSMQPMVEQPEAVLDMLLVDAGSGLLVLSANKVSSYRLAGGKWSVVGVAGVAWARPLPRDTRGRLENGSAGFRALVPGTSCNGTIEPEFKITCAPGNESWLLNPRDSAVAVRWVTDRNVLESNSAKDTFYSAGAGWFATSDDRILSPTGELLAGSDGWGSQISSVENPCGSGWMLLGSAAGDAQDRDQIQAYEVVDGQVVAASVAISLPGPVTALWPAETSGQTTLVIRNPKTGNSEASRLGVACAE